MEIVRTSLCWDGTKRDVLYVFRDPTPPLWQVDPDDEVNELSVLRALDEDEQETGEIAGVEMVDFLPFDRWEALPRLPILWQLPGWDPLPLDVLLKQVQTELRQQALSASKD